MLFARNDGYIISILNSINHRNSLLCINADRAFLKEIDGSCQTPIAAYAIIKDKKILLRTSVMHPEGKESYALEESCELDAGEQLGKEMAQKTKQDAAHILSLILKHI